MENIEKSIIAVLGYHAFLVESNNGKFWAILDDYDHNVGYLEYDESLGIYHIHINAPTLLLDTKRHKDSNEIKCTYETRFIYDSKGTAKAKIFPR